MEILHCPEVVLAHGRILHRPLVIHRSDGDAFKAVGNYPANMVASSRTQRLVKYLMNWKSAHKVLSQRAEQLWSDLHQEGYVGRQDVEMIKEWLQQLARMNYTFPALNEDGANMNTINDQHLVQHYMDPQDDSNMIAKPPLLEKQEKHGPHLCAQCNPQSSRACMPALTRHSHLNSIFECAWMCQVSLLRAVRRLY